MTAGVGSHIYDQLLLWASLTQGESDMKAGGCNEVICDEENVDVTCHDVT